MEHNSIAPTLETTLRNRWAEAARSRRKWLGLYTLLFLLLFLAAFAPFWTQGKTFVWDLDGRDQMLPWLAYTGRWLRACAASLLRGTGLPMYDLSLGWGDDSIGYLGSSGQLEPVSALLAALVPVRYTEILYIVLVVARLYAAGLSFLYLCAFFRKPRYAALTGAVGYGFCGYTVYCGLG